MTTTRTLTTRDRMLTLSLMLASSRAAQIGGAQIEWADARDVAARHSADGMARIVERYAALVDNSPRRPCPECDGSGLMTYPFVGDNCPCLTCSTDCYDRGRGWIEALPC